MTTPGTLRLGTPNLGTGLSEDRDRVDFAALRRLRAARVFAWMDAAGIDVLVLGREANVRYLTGARRLWTALSRPFGPTCIAVGATRAVHILSFSASYEGMPAELEPDDVYAITWDPMNLVRHIQGMEATGDARRVGVDGLTPLFDQVLRLAFPAGVLVGVQPELLEVRRPKLDEELDCLRVAAAIAESALVAALERVAPGRTGKDLQAAYLARMCELGTSQFAQQGVFGAVGPAGALRWKTTEDALADGTSVACAGGVLWAGYEGSLARTWWCGSMPPPASLATFHARYAGALDAVRAACRPGATGAALWSVLVAAGADPTHSAVYSLGLGHEGPIAAGWLLPASLERQCVRAPSVLGVRILFGDSSGSYLAEDMVAVGTTGTEQLTTLGYGSPAAITR